MKICVAGLGLIGGSVCMALKRAGYAVGGYNRSEKAVSFALSRKIIDCAAQSLKDYDVVFVALPPQVTVNFIANTPFKDGAVVCDLCGVKSFIGDAVNSAKRNIRYVGAHPMAGKEVSGIENACADLFDRASMVITHGEKTDKDAVNVIKKLVKDMGFKYIVECSPKLHDRKIAYTSQLAHVVSNCYVNDPEIDGCLGFTGGSFQDMTRIAGVDENMWAQLFCANKENLIEKVLNLRAALDNFLAALESGDEKKVKEVFSVGAKAYRDGKAEDFKGDGITVTQLK